MKTITILFSLLAITIVIGINVPTVKAGMPTTYPVWGYNAQDHICQIKQEKEDGPISENLLGDYWNIRKCRYNNPEIIFYTGSGILIWFGIFLFAFFLHHIIFPKLENRKKTERILFFLQDSILIGIILFFTVLLQHFFNVPIATYQYSSDIDHIVYSTFIKDQVPILFAGAYFLISLARLLLVYWKNKK